LFGTDINTSENKDFYHDHSEDLPLLQEQVAVGLQTAEVGPAYRQAAEVGPAYRLDTSTELATIRAELGNFP
jgi:hypothetical protein